MSSLYLHLWINGSHHQKTAVSPIVKITEEDLIDVDDNFRDVHDCTNRYFPNQKDLNDLIRDLGLTKSKGELLTSRLKQWNLVDDSV